MVIKNIHEKLLNGIQQMLVDTRINLPYYGEFNLHISFHEQESIGTCAVNVTAKGMNFYYSPKFLADMSQREINYIILHENFHLLFDHPRRTVTGQYDHKMSNIVQDMIINHIIWEDIPRSFVEIPKSPDGKNMALFVPKEYTGKLIFEELYEWMKDEKEKWQKENKQNCSCKSCNGTGKKQEQQKGQGQDKSDQQGQDKSDQQGQGQDKSDQQGQGQDKSDQQGQGQDKSDQQGQGQPNQEPCPDCGGSGSEGGKDSTGKPSYGPYGKNPGKDGDSIDTWSKEQIFENMENNNGEYLDKHIGDEVPEEMRDAMVKDVMERLQARGLTAGNIETTLNKLRKKRKDYLKEIKRAVSNMMFGTNKIRTIVKPNRKQISGIKGTRKVKTAINVILDTSGSMGNTFSKVLSYIYRSDITVNMVMADTEVQWVGKFMEKKKIDKMVIRGHGGTVIGPAIDYVADNFNQYPTCILSDGYTESLNLSRLKGKVLIISIGTKCPIAKSNGRLKQICVDIDTDK